MNIQYQIRKAIDDDVPRIYEIENQLFDPPYTVEIFHKEIAKTYSIVKVIMENGLIIGYYLVWLIAGEAELQKIAVSQENQNCGIGAIMLNDMFLELTNINIGKIILEVNEQNLKAVNLYCRNGFVVNGRRKKYYHTADALLMEKFI